MNMLIFTHFDDPSGHLAWLIDELQDSEDVGERVSSHYKILQ